MRRKIQIFLILAIVLVFSQIVLANNGAIQISMNGTKVSVREVPIIMDGVVINTEFPSFVLGDRTLVPVRFVAENYGAEVNWVQETRTVIVKHDSKEANFTIDSNIATINGEKKILDKNAIPKLVSYNNEPARTMVPLRFVTEIFGYDVGYDNDKNAPYIISKNIDKGIAKIKEITVNNNSPGNIVNINSDKELKYNKIYLEESNKIVIDIENTKLDLKSTGDRPGTLEINNENIEKIQYSQFSYDPMISRVVVTLKGKIPYNISSSKNGLAIGIGSGQSNSNNNSSNNSKIGKITSEIVNGRQALVVSGAGKAKINFMKLKNPERIVIDLQDSNLTEHIIYSYDYEIGFIKGVRVSQFAVDENYNPGDQVVRIVLDIKEGYNDSSVKVDYMDDNIVIYPEKDMWENLYYNKENGKNILNILNSTESEYTVELDDSTKNMIIIIPAENSNLEEGIISVKDNLINEIQVEKDAENVTMHIQFRRGIDYTLLSSKKTKEISIMFEKIINTDNWDKLIVIDAGHGGKDPGATSVTKKTEKELNLTISLKLQEALEKLGYSIIMTRDTDEYIDLYERARIANDNNADLFVSIHGNSNVNNIHHGVQILYCPAYDSDIKEVDQHPFAKSIMDALLEGTGANDKGIIKRPKLVVLRETKMPAVIVETGFLSNAKEEKLLYTDEYQNKIVESIVKGIENYLDMN